MNRILLAAAAFAAFSFATASAQNAPSDKWCRDQPLSRGSVMICSAYTFDQCMASRTSHMESCYLNPKYDPRFADWRRRNPHY